MVLVFASGRNTERIKIGCLLMGQSDFMREVSKEVKGEHPCPRHLCRRIPLLDHVNSNGSNVLADRGYDCNKIIDYIYAHGGEPTIPSRKGAKFERHCDWWLYKERHLVENYFLKLRAYRRIATRYDKLASTFLGFICIASILIWLK